MPGLSNSQLTDPQPSSSSPSTAAVVYLILSHDNPNQVIRLAKTLKAGSPTSSIVIHHDYSRCYLDPSDLADMEGVYVLEKHIAVRWGHFSIVAAVLLALRWILTNLTFDWLVLLSGQDYPIRPLSEIEGFLATTPYDGFISGARLDRQPGTQTLVDRYYYSYHRLPSMLSRVLRRAVWINGLQSRIRISTTQIGLRSRSTPFTPEFPCYKGETWFTLSYMCVRAIDDFVRIHPQFIAHYERTLNPAESFFLTILRSDSRFKMQGYKRYIVWRPGTSHPEILRVTDFDRIIASSAHFARKFDISVDAQVLDMLDRVISR